MRENTQFEEFCLVQNLQQLPSQSSSVARTSWPSPLPSCLLLTTASNRASAAIVSVIVYTSIPVDPMARGHFLSLHFPTQHRMLHHQASTSERRRSCGEFLCISNFGTWGRCWFGWSWVLFISTVGPLQPLRGQLLHSYSSLTAVSRESLMSSPTRLVPSLSAPSWCLFFLFFFSVGAEQAFLETEGQVVTSTCSTDSAH